MAGFYDDMRAVAADVMREFKQGSIRIVQQVTAAGSSPDRAGATTKTFHSVDGAAKPVSTKYVDQQTIKQTDMEVTFPAGVIAPTLDMMCEIDGVEHSIIRVMDMPEAGTTVAHKILVRR